MRFENVEKIAAAIEASLFKNASAQTLGMLKSQFRGSGLQFREHQIYNPGDDVRFIDWKLSAKSSKTYVKTFEEERNVEVSVYLPLDPLMSIGYYQKSKLQVALEIVYLLFLLTDKTSDKVRLNLIHRDQFWEIPPCSGRAGIVRLINLLYRAKLMDEQGRINRYADFKISDFSAVIKKIKKDIIKRKEVLFLAAEPTQFDLLGAVAFRQNFHYFYLQAPLDTPTSFSATVWARTNDGLAMANAGDFKEVRDHPRVKKLLIDQKYLDQFVRHLSK